MTLALETILACPRCHGPFERQGAALVCLRLSCGFRAVIEDGIVNVMPTMEMEERSFFDGHFPVMMHSSDEPGSHLAFYAQQAVELRHRLRGAQTILDVGCGPKLQYDRPAANLLFGLDMSYESLRHNLDVDVPLWGSATSLPLPTRTVDAIVCLYSLHHLVGQTIFETRVLVRAALREFARVLRPGGDLLVFEIAPWWPVCIVQRLVWNFMRRRLKESLNVFFWRRRALETMATTYLPLGTRLEYRAITVSPFLMFPFAFTFPRLHLPRLLYPFDISVYIWRMP